MHTPLLSTARRWVLAAAAVLAAAPLAQAQFTYSPTQAQNVAGTFTDLGATGTAIATANTDDANSAAQNIGFTFNFNGTAFTQFVLNTNGLLRLGAAAPSVTTIYRTQDSATGLPAVDPVASTAAADVNLLMPFNLDLVAGTAGASYRVLTSGAAPARVCTIQWTNVSDKAGAGTDAAVTQFTNLTFQARLYEGSNNIEFVYGPATASAGTPLARFPNVGIKGSAVAQTVLANKTSSSTAWATTVFIVGPYGTTTHNVRSTFLPDLGRTYRFRPTLATTVDNAVLAVYTLGQISQATASPHAVRAVVRNNGGSTALNLPVTLAVTGANAFSNTQTVASLAAGASTTVTFAAYPLTATGTSTVSVSVPADDANSNNSSASQQVVSVGQLDYTDPAVTTFTGGLGSGVALSQLFVKYSLNGSGTVTNITPTFNASTVSSTFRVLVYNASGAGGLPGNVVYSSNDLTRPTTAGPISVAIPNAAVTGDFYVATRQMGTDNIGLAYQTEDPLRPTTFYFSSDGLAFTDLSTSTFPARLAIATTVSTAPVVGLPNNECAGAISLTPATTCTPTSGTTVGATQSLPALLCNGFTGSADDDVWYRFVATSASHAVTVAGSATFDAVVDVRSGACPGVNIGCADATIAGGTEVVNLSGLSVGSTYFVRVYSYDGAGTAGSTGTFSICVTTGSVVVCATPLDINTANITATSAQLTFTPLPGNTSYVVTYTPTGGATTTVTPAPTASPITLSGLAAGTTYAVTFQALCAGGGTAQALNFNFTTTGTAAVPANDNPTGATLLTVSATCSAITSTNVGATTTVPNGYTNPSTTPSTCGVAINPKDVWFRFTTLAGQATAVVTVNGTAAGTVRVFSATSSAGPFTQVSCTAAAANNSASPPLTLTGLTGNTTYYVSVAGYGSADTQGAFGICVTGTAGVAAPANDDPAGATLLTVNTTCVTTTSTNLGATTTAPNGYANPSTAPSTCGVATNPKDVWFRFTTLAGQATAVVTVNGTVAGQIRVFSAASSAGPFTQVTCNASGANNAQSPPVVLTGLSGNTTYYVAVAGYGSNDTQGAFTICVTGTGVAPCPAVTGLAASNITATNATLTFGAAAGASSYAVTYTPQGGTGQTFTATGSPVGLTGLLSGTLYTVRIVTNCAAGQTSGAATTSFTTSPPPCPPVDGLTATNVAATSATLTFNSFAGSTGFVVSYTPQGGTTRTQTVTGSPVALTGLLPGTTYNVSVVTTCAAGQTSAPVVTSFTTPFPPCPAATNLAVGNISTTGASVSFTPAAGATGYTVAYTPQGGATTTQTATGSPVTLAGLLPGTAYTVAITTNCAAGQTSAAASIGFTTTAPCLAVSNLTAGSISATGATLSFAPPAAGATSFTVTYTPAGGSTTTQTATGSPVVLTGLLPNTAYTATVVTNCGAGQTSPLASVSFTTTSPPCNAATNLAVGSIGATSASASFTPSSTATGYTVTLTPTGGAATSFPAAGSPVALSGLQPGTAYTVSLVSNCAAGQTSGPVTATFSTLAPAPTNGSASGVTDTGASIGFTPAAGASSYTVTVTPQGGTATTFTAPASPVALSGLLANTSYTVTVVANYPGGAASAPLTVNFRTLMPTATRSTLGGSPLAVFPNPAHRAFTLRLPALGTGNAHLTLRNALGQTVRTQALPPSGAATAVQVSVEGLPIGLYTLQVQAAGETATVRLLLE